MPAHGYSVRRPLAIVLTVVVLHALALWALQRSVLSMAPGAAPPLERVSARLVAPSPQAQRSSTPPVAATAAKNTKATAGGATRAAAVKATASPAAASTPFTPAARAASTAEVLPPRDVPTGFAQPVSQVPVVASGPVVAGTLVASSAPATTAAPAGVPGAQPVVRSGAAFVGSEAGNAVGSAPGSTAAKLERPSSSADYLRNPQPDYPRVSRQRGEQGRVVVNVLIGADGSAQKTELISSSGFERLDRAALDTVRGWRYVPGKRGGVPEAMWFAVPIQFVLQ